jgi:hypothetical protein
MDKSKIVFCIYKKKLGKYVCPLGCEQDFTGVHQVKEHLFSRQVPCNLKLVNEKGECVCFFCKKVFKFKKCLLSHMRRNYYRHYHEKNVNLPESIAFRKEWGNDISMVENAMEEVKGGIREHKLRMGKLKICEICGRGVGSNNFAWHMRTKHNGPKSKHITILRLEMIAEHKKKLALAKTPYECLKIQRKIDTITKRMEKRIRIEKKAAIKIQLDKRVWVIKKDLAKLFKN